MASQIIKVNLKKFKVNELILDNLASEYNGKVLAEAGKFSESFEIEFSDYNFDSGYISGEKLAVDFIGVLKATFLLK